MVQLVQGVARSSAQGMEGVRPMDQSLPNSMEAQLRSWYSAIETAELPFDWGSHCRKLVLKSLISTAA